MFKYSLLRYVPGKLGDRFRRRFRFYSVNRRFEDALRRCRGKVCIDLGANLGVYTRKMASDAKQVIAFEPDPWTHSVLQDNVADLDNVRLEQVAAGTSEGRILIYRHALFEEDPASRSQSTSVLLYNETSLSRESAIEVRQIDFVAFLADLDEDIGVLKVDIEGAEVDLLEALLDRPDILRRIDHIFVETHEHAIPEHRPRVKALRERTLRLSQPPSIDLDWH
ncbi:MAG: FkbM family methyltransferase [Defluviicoccus sp.]|nr:FkbM family methyltransferase [Defluviicoccus sp.]